MSEGTAENWLYRGISPIHKFNIPSLAPSPELAYVLGVIYSDGWLEDHPRSRGRIVLTAKDKDFVECFNRNICRVLNKKSVYSIHNHRGYWQVEAYSILLYRFLRRPIEEQKKIIEQYPECFIRALFDGDGTIFVTKHGVYGLSISSVNKEKIEYIKELLRRKFNIDSKIYGCKQKNKKKQWKLRIYKKDYPLFYIRIGFAIRRKQNRLSEAVGII